jgi:arylsulfatase A-like enzyme
MIVRWPGQVPAGEVSEFPWYFADFMPTAAELAGTDPPGAIDGISVLPALKDPGLDAPPRYFYWEFYERGIQQAIRWKEWKAIRLKWGDPLLLFDLSSDPGEETDVASRHPEIITQFEEYLESARTDSPNWPLELLK